MTLRSIALRVVLWLAIFVALFSSALIVLFESGALTPYVVETIDARLRPVGLAFHAQSIHWRPWSGLALENAALRTRAVGDSITAESKPIASLRRLEVGYRIEDLLRGDLRIRRVRLVRPGIDLDAVSRWSRAVSRENGAAARTPGGVPPFRIETFRIDEGGLTVGGQELLRDLRVRGRLEAGPEAWRLAIESEDSRLRVGRFDEQVSIEGGVELAAGILRTEELRVQAAGSTVTLRGHADPRGERSGELVVHGEAVPLAKVGEWLGVEHRLLRAEGRCDAVLSGRPDSLRVTSDLAATGEDGIERRIRFTGTRKGSSLAVEGFRFEAAPSLVELTGNLDLAGGPRLEGVAVFRHLDPAVLLADPELEVLSGLGGTIRLAGTGLTRATFRGSVDVQLEGATAFGLTFGAGTLQGTLDRGALAVEKARVEVAGSELEGSGSLDRDNVVQAEFRGGLADLAVLQRIGGAFRAAAPRGRGDVTVRVAGPVTAPELDAVLRLEEASIGGIEASRLELTAEALRLGDTRLEFRASGAGVGRGQRRFATLEAAGWADSSSVVLRTLEAGAESVTLSLAGRMDFGDSGKLDAIVERLELRAVAGDARWENAGPIRVVRTPEAVTVSGLDLRGDGGSVTGDVTVLPSGATATRAVGRAVDLALFSPFLTGGPPLGGRLDFDGDGIFGADTLAARLAFDVAGGRIGDRQSNRLTGRLVAEDERLELADVTLEAPFGNVFVSGELRPPARAIRSALFDREDRIRALQETSLRDLRVRIESWNWDWLWSRIPRAPVSGTAGRVEARFDGPYLAPTADLSVELEGGMVGDEPLESFRAGATFDGEALHVRDGLLTTGGHTVTITGVVPVQWTAADPRPRFRPGREVDLGMAAAGLPLEAMSRLVSLFDILEGTADARVTLRGLPGELRFGGEFAVTGARLTIPTFDEPLVDGAGRGTFDPDGVELAEMTFRDGRGGIVQGHGRVTLRNLSATDYDIAVEAREYHYRSDLIGVRAVGNGSMRILARTASDGRVLPFFQGGFRVTRADIGAKALTPPGSAGADAGGGQLPAGVVAPPEPPVGAEEEETIIGPTPPLAPPPEGPPPAPVLAEIRLRGDRNLWLKTPEMDLELTGDVTFHASERYMGLSGDVSTLRGSYSVLNSRFDVQRADVEFTDPANPASSYIDAEATTTVLDEKVTAYVTGTIAEPDIRLETESGMSEAEIYELLALRIKRGEGTVTQQEGVISNAFRRSYLAALTNRFGGELGREIGLDTFTYEEGDADTRSSVTLGKNVGRDFFFKYRQAVGSTTDAAADPSATRESLESPERALTIEYRLNRIFTVQGETGTLPPGDDYLNLDLKAEWGY